MIESILRWFIEHPSRRWIVITLTLLMLLAVVWPLADEYFALRERRAGLEAGLATTRESVERMALYRDRLEERRAELTELETRSLPETAMFAFREDVADMAREAGCQVRTMRVGQAKLRRWRVEDDPLAARVAPTAGGETPFDLRTQTFSLSVMGPVSSVKMFLNRVNQANKMMHTESLSVRPVQGKPQLAELDLELTLFALQQTAAK